MVDRLRNQTGAVLPSPVVILSILAVTFAAVAFFVTQGGDPEERAIDPAASESSESPAAQTDDSDEKKAEKPKPKKEKPPVARDKVSVVVFNNTNITGLAGKVSTRVKDVGWTVVAADNWYGTIPATTVYFGPGMKRAANQLALDLGVERVMPAVESMSSERLTLILTGELD